MPYGPRSLPTLSWSSPSSLVFPSKSPYWFPCLASECPGAQSFPLLHFLFHFHSPPGQSLPVSPTCQWLPSLSLYPITLHIPNSKSDCRHLHFTHRTSGHLHFTHRTRAYKAPHSVPSRQPVTSLPASPTSLQPVASLLFLNITGVFLPQGLYTGCSVWNVPPLDIHKSFFLIEA